MKYKAACFLIENMPGAFAVDEKIVAACQPFYQMYDSLSHTYDYDSLSIYDQYPRGKDWGRQIDSLWNAYSSYNNEKLKKDMCIDIKTIKASRLITEIEQAFRVWKENVYTRNYSFETFCDYILPYRQENGLLVDSAFEFSGMGFNAMSTDSSCFDSFTRTGIGFALMAFSVVGTYCLGAFDS